ncbi:Putative membrane protein [Pseudomonas [fluorescens] SBW25]|uniref:Membrane protein n=1 Tax=Pseudomonas fluorescens (strain SBW25) TaxID=216595 RepID=C3K2I4_PSEFS|nr:Putative membrane protein [Pseudomonas fluorescens SBW25]
MPRPIMPNIRTVPNVAFATLAIVGCLISVRGKKRMPMRLARFVVLLEPT